MAKMKEMCIDLSRNPAVFSPVVMDSQTVKLAQQYKYLSIVIDNKLCFESQVDAACKKNKSTSADALLSQALQF